MECISFVAIALLVIAGVVASTKDKEELVQYAKRVVGRRVYGGQSTFLPLRVNMGGVIPIIFAMSVMMFPGVIVPGPEFGSGELYKHFNFRTVLYNALYDY